MKLGDLVGVVEKEVFLVLLVRNKLLEVVVIVEFVALILLNQVNVIVLQNLVTVQNICDLREELGHVLDDILQVVLIFKILLDLLLKDLLIVD